VCLLSGTAVDAEAALRGNSNVAYFEADRRCRPTPCPTTFVFVDEVGFAEHRSVRWYCRDGHRCNRGWEITTGSTEVVVGVIDSASIRRNVDLDQNIWLNTGRDPTGFGDTTGRCRW